MLGLEHVPPNRRQPSRREDAATLTTFLETSFSGVPATIAVRWLSMWQKAAGVWCSPRPVRIGRLLGARWACGSAHAWSWTAINRPLRVKVVNAERLDRVEPWSVVWGGCDRFLFRPECVNYSCGDYKNATKKQKEKKVQRIYVRVSIIECPYLQAWTPATLHFSSCCYQVEVDR